ncbi:hypothetical protein MKP05_09055 [Halomonas sp. EGI 63088]|uniref:Uncharacterized protein n=1 Tax=Halomonas flagellata TaxID=2920385 RepID=A0ABS9RTW8_9GAMM|nr:hypothetical protein [Halomonas flagellata]MCH4563275.1 hypothetical protein [Halomonas flagellata]
MVEEVLSHTDYQPSFISAFHLASMPARYAVERRQWGEAAALTLRMPDYLPWDDAPWAEGLTWLARGLGALHSGKVDAAQEAEDRLIALRDAAAAEDEATFATYIEMDRLILAGWIARTQDRPEEAIKLIGTAAEPGKTHEKTYTARMSAR